MPQQEQFKRHTAYKLKIGDVLSGKPILDEERFRFIELADKQVARVNIIANITDKFVQEGEKKFGSITLDDASGQIKAKVFGDDIAKFEQFSQGDTVMIIGMLRQWNDEIYLTPEIIRKKTPEFLLVRKLETDLDKPKVLEKSEVNDLRNKIVQIIKSQDAEGGAEIDKVILDLKSQPATINQEVKKLLEEGLIYEPRPGKLRYLG